LGEPHPSKSFSVATPTSNTPHNGRYGLLAHIRAQPAAELDGCRIQDSFLPEASGHRCKVHRPPSNWICRIQDGGGCCQCGKILQQVFHPHVQDLCGIGASCKYYAPASHAQILTPARSQTTLSPTVHACHGTIQQATPTVVHMLRPSRTKIHRHIYL
jgi:hypothetical protein